MKIPYLKAATTVLLAGACAHGFAQQSHWADANDSVAKMMIDSERKWAEANCDHNRIAETVLAEDFLGTAPDGSRYERAKEIQSDPSHADRNCRFDGAKVRFFSADLAMVYGSERSARTGADGKETMRCLVWSDTWLKRNGRWQIISAQDTQVACK